MEIRVMESMEDAGGVALLPCAAEVNEEANGEYSLTVMVARDREDGRERLLKTGKVLRVRVPGRNLPLRHIEKSRGTVPVYRVKGLPVQIRQSTADGEDEVTVTSWQAVPLWQESNGTKYMGRLMPGERVTGVPAEAEETGARCRVLTAKGLCGWTDRAALTEAGTAEGDVWTLCDETAGSMTEDHFRITQTEIRDGQQVCVTARHIYYDCDENEVPPMEWQNAVLSDVLDWLSRENGRITLLTDCDIRLSGRYGGACSAIVKALCAELDLQLVREGRTAYLLAAENTERRFVLNAENDIAGYLLEEDAREVITGVIPWVRGAAGACIMSPQRGRHPGERTVIEEADSVEAAQAAAEKRWLAGEDRVKTSVTVRLCGNALTGCGVFDRVRLRDRRMAADAEGAVCVLRFDPLRERVTGVRLGTVKPHLKEDALEKAKGSWQRLSGN